MKNKWYDYVVAFFIAIIAFVQVIFMIIRYGLKGARLLMDKQIKSTDKNK